MIWLIAYGILSVVVTLGFCRACAVGNGEIVLTKNEEPIHVREVDHAFDY